MRDSLDLDALRQEAQAYTSANFRQRCVKNAERVESFVACLKALYPEIQIEVPASVIDASKRTRNPRGGIIMIYVMVFLISVIYIPAYLGIPLLLIAGWWILGHAITRLFRPSGSQIERRQYRTSCLLFMGWSLLLAIIMLVSFTLLSRIPGLSGTVSFLLGVIIMQIAGAVLPRAYIRLPVILIIRGPFAHADYNRAFRHQDSWRWMLPPYPHNFLLTARILNIAGRYQETIALAWHVLTTEPPHYLRTKSFALSITIDALLGQKRYAKALPLIECFVQYFPMQSYPYRLLLEYYTEQNTSPERALEVAELLKEFTRKPHLNFLRLSMEWEHDMAIYAEAIAQNGRYDEARTIISEMIKRTASIAPYTALMNYRAGRIELSAGDTQQAQRYFQQALALDPNGATGQKAKTLLDVQ